MAKAVRALFCELKSPLAARYFLRAGTRRLSLYEGTVTYHCNREERKMDYEYLDVDGYVEQLAQNGQDGEMLSFEPSSDE